MIDAVQLSFTLNPAKIDNDNIKFPPPSFNVSDSSLNRYRMSVVIFFKNAWSFLSTLFSSCFSVFIKAKEPRENTAQASLTVHNLKIRENTAGPSNKGIEKPPEGAEPPPNGAPLMVDNPKIRENTAGPSNKGIEEPPEGDKPPSNGASFKIQKDGSSSPGTEQKRRMRPARFDIKGRRTPSIFIEDDKIIEKEKWIRTIVLDYEPHKVRTIFYTKNGKAIFQQQSPEGAFEAAKFMLFLDNAKNFEYKDLNDGNTVKLLEALPLLKRGGMGLSKTFALLIKKSGPAIVAINAGIGNHYVIVDHISQDGKHIRIRDPFHGWEITLASNYFETMLLPHEPFYQMDYQILSSMESESIKLEIGYKEVLKSLSFFLRQPNRIGKAVVVEGDSKVLCVECKEERGERIFTVNFFKDNKLYTLAENGVGIVKMLTDSEKSELLKTFYDRKIDLPRVK